MRKGSLGMDVSNFSLGHIEFEVLLEIRFRCGGELKPEDIDLLVIVTGIDEAIK